MDPVFQRLGDVTIQRLEKPKDKVGLQGSGDIMEKESKEERPEQNIYLNTEDSQGVKRNFDNVPGPSTKRIKFDRLDFKRNMDESSAHSFSEPELTDYDTDSELESEEDMPMMKSQNSHMESVTSELETSTDFLEKLVQEPFEEHESEELKTVDEIKTEVDDYEYDIKEKLKEMGEISFETVKKGEKPKKTEVTIENEVVVTPAKKMAPIDEDPMGERLKSGNMRRNIREVMDETKLDESTLAAQRQEMERLRRVQEQQRIIREVQRQMAQDRVISLLQGGNMPKAGTSGARIGNTVLVKLPNGQTKTMTKLTKKPFDLVKVPKSAIPPTKTKSLIAIKKPPGNLTPSVSIAPVMKRMPPHFPMAPSDTDSENEEEMPMIRRPMSRAKPKDPVATIDISSDDDCIVVSEPENDPSDDVDEDPSNSGMHTNDEFNQPDEQGRVVVNIGNQEGEPDIYLAPQIARIIKPHQIGGIRFLFDNVVESVNRFETSTGFGCILAHSMGLGKTLQVVSFTDIFLRNTPAKTILCIMPINTLQNWMAEYNMWLPTEEASGNSPLIAHGEVRPRNFNLHVLNDSHKTLAAKSKVIREWKNGGGVLLIGYEQYRLLSLKKHPKSRRKPAQQEPVDDDKNKLLFDEVHEALVKPGPDLVICDEGHRIKNSHASISQALKQMRTKRRVVLTGYPLQNNLMEYWCMVDFVRPNYLGTKTEFCNMFERPIQNGQCIDSTEADIKLMRYRAHVLHSLLVGFVQRRSHTVLQTALPQKEEYVLLVRMTDFQRTLYETFMNEVVRTQTVPNPLKAFAVCCKIWNHPDVLYYFLKKQAGGEAVDIDLEEVSNSTASSNESAAKTKKGSKKSLAKGKNSGKPAASVTPYNSSGDALKKTTQRNKNSAANKNNANNINRNQATVLNNAPINQQNSQPSLNQNSSNLSQSSQQPGFTPNSTGNYQNNMDLGYSPNKQMNNFNEIQQNQGSNQNMPLVKQEDDTLIQNNQVGNSTPNSVSGFSQKVEYNNFCPNQSTNFIQNPPSNYSDSGFSQQTMEYSQNSQGSTFSTSSATPNPPSNMSQETNFSSFSQTNSQIFPSNQPDFVQNQFSANPQNKTFTPPSSRSKPTQQEEFVANNFSAEPLKNPAGAYQNAVANFPDGSSQTFPLDAPNSNFPVADSSSFAANSNQNSNFSSDMPPHNSAFPVNNPQNSNFPSSNTQNAAFPINNSQGTNFPPNNSQNSNLPANNTANTSFSSNNPQSVNFTANNQNLVTQPGNQNNFSSNESQNSNYPQNNIQGSSFSSNQNSNFTSSSPTYTPNTPNTTFLHPSFNANNPTSNITSNNQSANFSANNQNTNFCQSPQNSNNFPSNNQSANFSGNNQTSFTPSNRPNTTFPNNHNSNFGGNPQNCSSNNQPSNFPTPNAQTNNFVPNNHNSNYSQTTPGGNFNQILQQPEQPANFQENNQNNNFSTADNFNQNTFNPPNNQTTFNPPNSQTPFNQSNNQATFNPPNSQTTFNPPNNQTTFNPQNTQTTFNPPTIQSTFNQSNFEQGFNQNNHPTGFTPNQNVVAPSQTPSSTFNNQQANYSQGNYNTANDPAVGNTPQSNFSPGDSNLPSSSVANFAPSSGFTNNGPSTFVSNNSGSNFTANQSDNITQNTQRNYIQNPSFPSPNTNQVNNFQPNPSPSPTFSSNTNAPANYPSNTNPPPNFSSNSNQSPNFPNPNQPCNFPSNINQPPNFSSNVNQSNFPQNPSQSPSFPQNPSQSPSFPQNASQSPSFPQNPSQSPSFPQNPSQSPSFPQNPSQSPTFPQNPTQSPTFPQNPSPSPSFPQNPSQSPSFSQNTNQPAVFPQNTNQPAAFLQNANQPSNFPQNPNQPTNFPQNPNQTSNFQTNSVQPPPNFPSNANQTPKQSTNFTPNTNQSADFPISSSNQSVVNFSSPNCPTNQQQQIGNLLPVNQQTFPLNKETNFLSNQQGNSTNNQSNNFPLNDQQGTFAQNNQQGNLNPSNQQGNYLPNGNQQNNLPMLNNQQGNFPPSNNHGNFSNNNSQTGNLSVNNQQGNFASGNNQQGNFPQNNPQANFSPASTTTSQNQQQQHNQPFPSPSNIQSYQQQQGLWGQDSNFKQPNDTYNNFRPPFNQNFTANPPWMKKDDIKPIINSPIKLEGGSSSDTKPKINIISDIKISSDGTFDMKKINILSDIKLDPKKEFDEMKDEKLDIKNMKSESTKMEPNDEEFKVVSEAPPTTKAATKEDTGIPYDWAIELLKDYVPGIIENSAKMDILFCIIRESIALGDRLLVFSQSLITLDLIEQFLQMNSVPGETHNWAKNTNYYRLDGSTSALEREKLINEFNSNPKIYLFLVSTRAGSLGINLIGANRVVVLDASWNPCHDTQAVCRVYRYGQRKPCFVYRLVVDNCLEKKIYDRQINKQGMSDRVVDECNPDAHLTMKDVSTLCWDDAEEGEVKDWSHCKDNYIDVVLQKVLIQYGTRLNKEPFQHESLLVDRKDKQLSQQEKRLAKKGYEREKQAARQPAYNVGSTSRGHRPVASVRPMQQGGERPTRWIPAEHWQRQGMTAQEMTLPLDVVIPTNQPDKGNIVLKAGQKVLVLKSPKGVYMQLESGKIVAIKTAIKVRGKAEEDAAKAKSTMPPAIKNNAAISVVPQKRAVKPFTPNLGKLNMRSIKQNVPNLVSRIQSVTKRVQTAKTKPYQIGQEIARAVSQAKSETESHPSSSDEERAHVEKRHFNFSKDSGLTIEPKIKDSGDTSRSNSLERREVSSSEIEIEKRIGTKPKNSKSKAAKRASALERLEQSTIQTIMSESKQTFQETLDSITSTYPEEEKLSDNSSHASTTHSANQSSQSISSTSDQEVIPVEDQPYQSESETTPSVTPADPSKSDIPTPEYGYNNYYGYNHMQPYPPPPQGYPGYPQPPPYDMMGYPQPQQPQYNYGMYPPQGYPPQHQYPPQGPYDYGQPPPQGPVYPGYHSPYPPQQYPPPPQGMYPPPGAPPPAGFPEYQYAPPPPPHNTGPPPPAPAPYYPGH